MYILFLIAAFDQKVLEDALLPTWDSICKKDKCSLFQKPVDPQALRTYFDIVKKPMDLSTIKTKLTTGQYPDPREYVDDVWLMFENALLFNRLNRTVYEYCKEVNL